MCVETSRELYTTHDDFFLLLVLWAVLTSPIYSTVLYGMYPWYWYLRILVLVSHHPDTRTTLGTSTLYNAFVLPLYSTTCLYDRQQYSQFEQLFWLLFTWCQRVPPGNLQILGSTPAFVILHLWRNFTAIFSLCPL